ncbi:MAG: diguanylate cyclase, partial [Acidobacteria bacterium]|nr:diguanylate cyclase [Acidobacteriota bacterium]
MPQTPEFFPNLYRELLDAIADGVYFTDRERRIAFWNRGAEALTGYARDEVIGRRCMDNLLVHVDNAGTRLCFGACPLAATLENGEPREADVYLHHKNGHRVPVRVRVFPIRDDGGAITGAVEVFNDNTATRRAAAHLERMERLALLDHLTGIANRRGAEAAIRSRLEELRRNGWGFGVLLLDIDDFKAVNDSCGHETGDRVLRLVARTLEAGARSFDLVGRWGG